MSSFLTTLSLHCEVETAEVESLQIAQNSFSIAPNLQPCNLYSRTAERRKRSAHIFFRNVILNFGNTGNI